MCCTRRAGAAVEWNRGDDLRGPSRSRRHQHLALSPGPVQWFIKLFMLSNEQGAVPLLYCATAPELSSQTGRYYDRSREILPAHWPPTTTWPGSCGSGRKPSSEPEFPAAFPILHFYTSLLNLL